MSRIDQTFKRLRKKGQVALIPFIVAGDPDIETTEALVFKMAEAGADIIELGVPFSDPFWDGPIIRSAHQRALKNGISLREVFQLSESLKGISAPLVLMTYLCPVSHCGLKNFAKDCKGSRINGVLIPDLPFEEAGPWIREVRKIGLDSIFLIAPNSRPGEIRWTIKNSNGFIYYISSIGKTGPREKLPEGLEGAVRQVKAYTTRPVAVGFGISTPEQARAISRFADGVVVGSAIVKIIEENLKNPNMVKRVGDSVASFAKALKGSGKEIKS